MTSSDLVADMVDTRVALGRQMTLECYECSSTILANPQAMEQVFLEAAQKSGATIISSHFHAFVPQGISGVVIISESHFAVHAWPEHDYAAVDIFTCGDSIDFDLASDLIRDGLNSKRTIVSSLMNRGIVNNQGVERMVTVCEDELNSYSLSWKNRYERSSATGISVSVDLYDCDIDNLFPLDAVESIMEELQRSFGIEAMGRIQSFSNANGEIVLRQNSNNGMLSIRIVGCRVYLDLMAMSYFEPRIIAELGLESFKGKHYRMQIAIRQ